METPIKRILRSHKATFGTPIHIPATPLLHRLGYGTGVEVYRVQRTPAKNVIKSPWAVKRITKRMMEQGSTHVYKERIHKEAKILRKLNHPNIIGFRGLTQDEAGRDVLALEICSASLCDLMDKRKDEDLGPLPSNKCLKVILDMASALVYLHHTALILHGDLKGANVLVNGDYETCKLCDFGVSLPLTKKGRVDVRAEPRASYVGTEIWAGPEVLEYEGDISQITTKTDMFSFGCTIYEMLTLSPPHLYTIGDGDNEEDDEDESSVGINRKALDFEDAENYDSMNLSQEEIDELEDRLEMRSGTRPPLPEDIQYSEDYNPVLSIFFVCTSMQQDQRPTAKDVVETVQKLNIL